MNFTIQRGLILVSDGKPASHVTLFTKVGALRFRPDASVFDDLHESYTWAFEGGVDAGDHVIFAAADRAVSGTAMQGGWILVEDHGYIVERGEGGKPLSARLPGAADPKKAATGQVALSQAGVPFGPQAKSSER